MYKSRKKIIAVGCVSLVVLVGFGVGAWAIIDASYKNPSGDATQSKYFGATEYLSNNNGQFDVNTMSVSDWINYNMPQTLLVTKNSDGSKTLDFYNVSYSSNSDLDTFVNTNKYIHLIAEVKLQTSATSYNYTIYTNPYASNTGGAGGNLELASSNNSISGNTISIDNKVGWSDKDTNIVLNITSNTTDPATADNSNTQTINKEYISSQNISGYSVKYTDNEVTTLDANNQQTGGTSTRTFSVANGNNVYTETYTKQLTSDNNNFTIKYNGSLDSSLTAAYTYNTINDSTYYYGITYTNNSNTPINSISTYQSMWFNNDSWQMSLPKDINLFFFLFS